ncbi:g9273 [Coccomyxa elongata]
MAETQSVPPPKPPSLQIELDQEAALIAKYGMRPKLSPRLLAKRSGRKCFDSADFVLQQQGRLSTIVSGDLTTPEQPIETLSPKLSPTQPRPRRHSNLGDND